VTPSLPGYGFSGKPTEPGWNPVSIAKAWARNVRRERLLPDPAISIETS